MLSSVFFNNAIAHSTITYAYPPSPHNLNQCKAKANTALNNSGYTIYSSASEKYVAGTKGEFRTIIVCDAAARSGIAFIIVNGNDGTPRNEMSGVQKNFSQDH